MAHYVSSRKSVFLPDLYYCGVLTAFKLRFAIIDVTKLVLSPCLAIRFK